jgi:hypothetical protein
LASSTNPWFGLLPSACCVVATCKHASSLVNWSLPSTADSLDRGPALLNRGCEPITSLLLQLHRIASCLSTSSIVCAKMCILVDIESS